MTLSPHNLLAHEIIGLAARVVDAADPTLKGLSGIVRDETRNMVTMEVQHRLLAIPKRNTSFNFMLPTGDEVKIEGSKLAFRSEDRVKRGLARW